MNRQVLITSVLVFAVTIIFVFVYFSATDQNNSQMSSGTNSIEEVPQNVVTDDGPAPAPPQTPTVESAMPLNGVCVKGASYIPSIVSSLVEAKSGYVASSATFSCLLNDRTFLAGGEGQFWSHDFTVVQFDESGNVRNTVSKDDGNAAGGEFEVSNVVNGIFTISHRIIDSCYDATTTFTFDLKTGKYSEVTVGGNDVQCWEEPNARGGV